MAEKAKAPANRRLALVLSGGAALGAYQGGAYEVLHKAGLRADLIVGASIGAVNAAIIAGNPPERRVERLREFWDSASQPGAAWTTPPGFGTKAERMAGVVQTRMFGQANMFRPRFPGALSMLPGMPDDNALYDLAPLRRTLERLVDFERLNGGETALCLQATDAETGEDVLFDNRRRRIGTEHILASGAFMPDFQPIEVDGRYLCDGGLGANLPVHVALGEAGQDDLLCFAVDVFDPEGERPTTLDAAFERRMDLMFASQTRRTVMMLETLQRLKAILHGLGQRLPPDLRDDPTIAGWLAEGSGVSITLMHLLYHAGSSEVGQKMFDFSPASIRERWQAGARDMGEAVKKLAALAEHSRQPGLAVHRIRR